MRVVVKRPFDFRRYDGSICTFKTSGEFEMSLSECQAAIEQGHRGSIDFLPDPELSTRSERPAFQSKMITK